MATLPDKAKRPLWAPWRIEYIISLGKKKSPAKKCVFCTPSKSRADKKNLVLYRGEYSYVIMNRYPYSNGHLMVIPYRHTADFGNLTSEEHQEMGELLSLAAKVLKKAMGAHGLNIGMNLGEAAGAGIREHLHYHIVPRWNGDTNFMPVFADVRLIYEHMSQTYDRLFKEFEINSAINGK